MAQVGCDKRNVFYHLVEDIRKNVHGFMERIMDEPMKVIDRLCVRMESSEFPEVI